MAVQPDPFPYQPPTARWQRWRRRLTRMGGAVVVLVAALPWIIRLPVFRHAVERRIAARTGLACEIGRLDLGWNGVAGLSDLRLTRGDAVKISVSGLHASRPGLRALLGGRLEVHEVLVNGLDVTVALPPRPAETMPGVALASATPVLPSLPKAKSAPLPAMPAPAQPVLADAPTEISVPSLSLDEPPVSPSSSFLGPAVATAPLITAPVLPETGATPVAPPDAPAPAEPPAPTIATVPEQHPAPVVAAAAVSARSGRWRLDQVRMAGGQLRLLGADGKTLAGATGLAALLPASSTGRVSLDGLTVLGHALAAPATAEIQRAGRLVQVAPWAVHLPGGDVKGGLKIDLGTPGLPFLLEAASEGLDLATLAAVFLPDGAAPPAGRINGTVRLAGSAQEIRSLTGSGQAKMEGGALPLADWLKRSGFSELATRAPASSPVREARLEAGIQSGHLILQDAAFYTDELLIRALGLVSPRGSLNLAVRTYLSTGAAGGLAQQTAAWPEGRRISLLPLEDTPLAYHDFLVRGSLTQPRLNLWDREWSLAELSQELTRLRRPAQP